MVMTEMFICSFKPLMHLCFTKYGRCFESNKATLWQPYLNNLEQVLKSTLDVKSAASRNLIGTSGSIIKFLDLNLFIKLHVSENILK